MENILDIQIKSISFPEDEIESIKSYLKNNKSVYTTRVSNEYGKYRVGDIVKTSWNEYLNVFEIKEFADITSHPFYSELTDDQILLLKQYNKFQLIKLIPAYDPPLEYDKLPEHLKNDPIHTWRAKTGIELIHKEPTLEELNRIWVNWNLMGLEQKKISDKKSIEFFNMNNKDHYHVLLKEYEGGNNIMESILDTNVNYNESTYEDIKVESILESKEDSKKSKFPTCKPADEETASKCKHEFFYGGGICKCGNCGWYLSPGLKGEKAYISRTPTGRVGPKIYVESNELEDINESAKDSPESNVELTPSKAEQTLLTLTRCIMNNKGKVNDYTMNTFANIITNNLLSEWAHGFTKLNIKLLPEDSKFDFGFVTPHNSRSSDNEFVKRFIEGNETLSGYLRRSPEINIEISPKIFKNIKSDKDIITCFKNAIKYYAFKIDKGANELATQLMRLDTVTKQLLMGPLTSVIIYPITLLFLFQDINIDNSNNPFKVDEEMIQTINKFVANITETYSKPDEQKAKIIEDMKKLVDTLIKNVTYTETMKSFQSLPDIIKVFYNSGFDNQIKLFTAQFEFAQCEKVINPVVFNEKMTVKRLKKIPMDLIAYITIEGEAIKSVNDKMMIVSYAYGKLEIVEWYIELLEVGTKNYIVPHSREYLESVRTQLLAAIKTIMAVKIKGPDDPIISIKYPTGYEG